LATLPPHHPDGGTRESLLEATAVLLSQKRHRHEANRRHHVFEGSLSISTSGPRDQTEALEQLLTPTNEEEANEISE
jgi:hypothetical protein